MRRTVLYFPEELHEVLKNVAKENHVSISTVVRMILIEKYKQKIADFKNNKANFNENYEENTKEGLKESLYREFRNI